MARKESFIPNRDDDFYNLVNNIVQILQEPAEEAPSPSPSPAPSAAPSTEKWQAWGVPETKMSRLIDDFEDYEALYHTGQSKKSRTAADVDNHREARKGLEKYLREFVNQYLRYEDQVPRGEKVRMGIIPADTEPSPVHGSHLGTLAPVVGFKNMGGGKIDSRFRRTADQTRGSVPKGFEAELRYVIGIALPPDPEDIPSRTTVISSKSRFQFDAGMTNLGKTLTGYARWRHKTNPQFNSPWTSVMQIVIA